MIHKLALFLTLRLTRVRPVVTCLGAVLLVALTTSNLSAEYRTALLIANSDYPDARLASPADDVQLMSKVLQQRGFRTTVVKNLTKGETKEAVEEFTRSTPTVGTALIYFSGYALLGERGDNRDAFLMALDSNPESPYRVWRDGLGIRSLLVDWREHRHKYGLTGAKATFVVVDGCYAHPGQNDDAPPGLPVLDDLPPEAIVAYAAAPGKVVEAAEEGPADFTAELARLLQDRNRSLVEALESSAGHYQTTLSDSSFLQAPASQPVAVPTEFPGRGRKAGEEWVNHLGMVFCWCPPGTFTMGSPADHPLRYDDEGPVEVTLSEGFWIGKHEMTFREFIAIHGGAPYRSSYSDVNEPVSGADPTKLDSEILQPLNDAARKEYGLPKNWKYALPTEAQWEYAARAGTDTTWYFGNDAKSLPEHANFADRELYDSPSGKYGYADRHMRDGSEGVAVVGRYLPNAWGLHDVYGNVWEWCQDDYTNQLPGGVDPVGKAEGNRIKTVARGGCWLSPADYCRSAMRQRFEPGQKHRGHRMAGMRLIIRSTK